MSHRIRSVWIGAGIVGIILAAWFLGTEAGQMITAKKSRAREFTREVETQQLLTQMPLLQYGQAIPDHSFYLLDYTKQTLSSLIKGSTVIVFLDPTCEPCIREIEGLVAAVEKNELSERLLIVSHADFQSLVSFQREFAIPCPILYDQDGEYSRMINLLGSPFNLVVNREMTLTKAYYGAISPDEFMQAFEE